MSIAPSTRMTARQFQMLGGDPPGLRLELAHGEIVMSPSPSREHSFVDRMLTHFLIQHIIEKDLGELLGDVDTIFDDYNVRRPAILFIAKARLHLIKGHGVPIVPDLCIEILSPSSATTDQTEKLNLYARSGVPHYWIVDPRGRTFDAYDLVQGRFELRASGRDQESVSANPFPSLSIPLGQLWSPVRS